MSVWLEKVEEKENLEKAQCSRNGNGGPIRREISRDNLATVDRREIRSNAMDVDRSGTLRGFAKKERKEEEKEI